MEEEPGIVILTCKFQKIEIKVYSIILFGIILIYLAEFCRNMFFNLSKYAIIEICY